MVIIQLDSEQLFGVIENAVRKVMDERGKPEDSITDYCKTMSLVEFCTYTGLSKQTVYKLTSGQKVPHSKRGKRLYFDRGKVDAWLLECQVATHSEIQEKAKDYFSKKSVKRRVQ